MIAEYAMLDIKAPQWHIRWLINWLNGGFWPETWRMVASVALHILPTLPETGEGMGAETSGSEKMHPTDDVGPGPDVHFVFVYTFRVRDESWVLEVSYFGGDI